jgi:uncharacterized protein
MNKTTIGNKTIQYSVSAKVGGKMVKVMDTTSVQLPSWERQSDTIKGAGIMGEVDMPTAYGYSAASTTIAGRADSYLWAELGGPGRKDIEVRWVTDEFDQATGANGIVTHRVNMGCFAKKRDPGKVETNAAGDGSLEFSVIYYKNQINGKTVEEIDVLNSKCVINGYDYAAKVRSFL